MLSDSNAWFLDHEEPIRSNLIFLREHILSSHEGIQERWHYGMPFYFYKGKRFCYLWVHKKSKQPYVGFVDGDQLHDPDLLKENRSRMKIFLIDPDKNIPVKKLGSLLKSALLLHA